MRAASACLPILLAAALPGAARGQCTSTGPDLVVGGILSVVNVPAAGGHDAIALGVRFCNDGDVPLSWSGSTNQHPVTVANLYRLTVVDGCEQFEQIGMSWARHEAFPLQTAGCCVGCVPAAAGQLGVRCASESTAGAMGAQSGLGPRWEIDPESGNFPYPPSSPPIPDGTARRLRYAPSDVVPSGPDVRYLVELLSVTPDEAGGFNRDDNACWRAAQSAGGADPFFTLTGTSSAGQAAIEAWASGPGPSATVADASFGGRVVAAQRSVQLPDGWWRYEYSLYNHHSAAGVRAFSVPVPPGVALRAVGFHDVDYHSGDGPGGVNLDGADWSAELRDGRLVWSTAEWSANPQANALRWGTAYSFRFEASAAPAPSAHVLERFEPGTPATASVQLNGPGPSTASVHCTGDGSAAPCPCGNLSAVGAGEGCLHSLGRGGRLAVSGDALLAQDTLTLHGSGMPDAPALIFQGSALAGGGPGVSFGDGLRCGTGHVVRLALRTNVGGGSLYPAPGEPPVSVRGLVPGPGTRYYQVWFRNAAPFCTSDTFNLTNGVGVVWQ
jgi:hypothetical protein